MTQPFWQSDGLTLYNGNVPDILKSLPDKSVHVIVTSPPYWGLRDYDLPLSIWGGETGCEHEWVDATYIRNNDQTAGPKQRTNTGAIGRDEPVKNAFCAKCGAWFGCLGLEPTPQLFVQHLVEIFHEARRVLRDDGTCWVVIGDSYARDGGPVNHPGATSRVGKGQSHDTRDSQRAETSGLKPKDLCMIPARVALALQEDGWWLRSDIIWAKGSCMPESVTDRPTSTHEHIFLLAKSQTYYYDALAVAEKVASNNPTSSVEYREQIGRGGNNRGVGNFDEGTRLHPMGNRSDGTRNLRNVWNINPEPTTDKHYATFPTKLVKRCILAGTSGRGCCPKCGKPWERVLEKTSVATRPGRKTKPIEGRVCDRPGQRGNPDSKERRMPVVTDLGWRPGCKCATLSDIPIVEGLSCYEPYPPVPAVVLDPFVGSGTVLAVTAQLGRHGIGIDLSETYLRTIAIPRLEEILLQPKLFMPEQPTAEIPKQEQLL